VGGLRVVVACNDDLHLKSHLNDVERAGEEEVLDTAREIAGVLDGELLLVRDVREALDALRSSRPDVVFNLCEGVSGNPRWEMNFALALEMVGIPFTGCDPVATGICGDKGLTKAILTVGGIATPRGMTVLDPRSIPSIEGTWIVKPALEDAGIGIDAESVCTGRQRVLARATYVIETYGQPALVEEFIDGREINQSMFYGGMGPVMLPPGEIVFADALPAHARVVGWKAKWAAGSAEDKATSNRTPALMEIEEVVRVADLCDQAATLLSLGGYCRFDLRQRPTGELTIIDVNPNPDIGRDTGFRKALDAAGIAFPDFLNELMISALSRRR
jgi:D-alanine-D-alanine ligase